MYSRNNGDCGLPAAVKELFNDDSLRNSKDLRYVYHQLNEYTEQMKGFIETQTMDPRFMDNTNILNEDKGLMKTQQCLFKTTKPLLAMELTLLEESFSPVGKLEALIKINYDSIRFSLHHAHKDIKK